MKISVLQHNPSTRLPSRPGDPTPVSRNLNPLLHPFARARERTRALNAAKLERIFAKPFVAQFGGHMDAVECLARVEGDVARSVGMGVFASGSWDGGIVLHDSISRSTILSVPNAHKGKVSDLCFSSTSKKLISCGVDRTIRIWNATTNDSISNSMDLDDINDKNQIDSSGDNNFGSLDVAGPSTNSSSSYSSPQKNKAINVYSGKAAFNSIDHHRSEAQFASASNIVQLWDEDRTAPLLNLTPPTSTETITALKFHPSEHAILASVGNERTFTLYDVRTGKAERRVVMKMSNTSLSISPLLPSLILLGSNDHNIYSFDIRSLSSPLQIYKGHVDAVTSVDFSPTGVEFVSGGWDRTVRVWRVGGEIGVKGIGGAAGEGSGRGRKKDVYFTKRMQRITATLYTPDSRFILSASDDGNIRLWKASASEKLGVLDTRERAAIEYRERLKERWSVDNEVGKVLRSRNLPKPIYKANKLKTTMLDSRRVKEERRRKHTRAGDSNPVPEKKKVVIVEGS